MMRKHKKIFKVSNDVDFATFNNFCPRDEFLQNRYEVQVYFSKTTIGDDDITEVDDMTQQSTTIVSVRDV